MRVLSLVVLILAGVLTSGCARQAEAPPEAPAGTTMPAADENMANVPDEAVDQYCRVCYVNGGHKMAGEHPEKVEHDGKTYAFCSEYCYEAFKEDPEKFAYRPEGDASTPESPPAPSAGD